MKKFLFYFLILIYTNKLFAQTTAIDFTASDCSGVVSHHLYGELDAGNVICISFVEPCAACIGPTQTMQSVVQQFNVTNPGKVLFYVVDDYANTSCGSLNMWVNVNGLTSVNTTFSTPAFVISQYGAPSMPKLVVLGGPGHLVYLNAEGALTADTTIRNAISEALIATAVPNLNLSGFNLNLSPNPVKDILSVSYFLPITSSVSLEIYNLIGTKIYSIMKDKQFQGEHEDEINIGNILSNGIYFIKLTSNGVSENYKFIVEK